MHPIDWQILSILQEDGKTTYGELAKRVGLSQAAAQLFFYVYAAAVGLSLAFIFAVYTQTSIAQTFLVTAIAFAGLSLYGYTTKKDLSGMGTFLMMGLIGLVVAMIVNIFLASSAMAFIWRSPMLLPRAMR